jgi:acyl-CoA-binding protein|tara:strand:+ start:1987 stop:2256 length:270 start_codon:yes stop_codon:yes gene_type:complete
MSASLDLKFTEAFNELSELEEILAPDIMLKLYAYYKQAVIGDIYSYNGEVDVRDAFKFNAWTQLNGMTQEDAKKQYIKLAKKILKNQFK